MTADDGEPGPSRRHEASASSSSSGGSSGHALSSAPLRLELSVRQTRDTHAGSQPSRNLFDYLDSLRVPLTVEGLGDSDEEQGDSEEEDDEQEQREHDEWWTWHKPEAATPTPRVKRNKAAARPWLASADGLARASCVLKLSASHYAVGFGACPLLSYTQNAERACRHGRDRPMRPPQTWRACR